MDISSLTHALRKRWPLVLLLILVAFLVVMIASLWDIDFSAMSPEALLRKYGYWVILVWTFLEGETIVVIAGIVAASRPDVGLNPWLIALAAFCGSFCSDQVMFSLGKYLGEPMLKRFPGLAKNVGKASALFKKYDSALILGFRFVYGVRNVTPILLGISKVSHYKFFFLNAIGAGIWALCFSFGGYYAGKAFMRIMGHVGHGIFYGIIAAAVIAGLIWFFRSRRNVAAARKIAEQGHRSAAPENPEEDAAAETTGAGKGRTDGN